MFHMAHYCKPSVVPPVLLKLNINTLNANKILSSLNTKEVSRAGSGDARVNLPYPQSPKEDIVMETL